VGTLLTLVDCYAQADAIRKEILSRPLHLANLSIARIGTAMEHTQAVQRVEQLQSTQTKNKGGILSDDTIIQSNELLKIMNQKLVD
jgi:E3 ubiquitin-protein ligase SHPRH